MNRGIQQKLLWSFLGVAIISLLTINLLINIVISYSFSNYLDSQRIEETNILKMDLVSTYTPDIYWSSDTLMGISHYALMKNLEFRLLDRDGKILWDSSEIINTSLDHRKRTEAETDVTLKSEIVPLIKDGIHIGQLEIKPSNGEFHEHEAKFLSISNLLIWIAMVFVFVGVFFFSRYISKGISSPLIHIKNVALQMKEGNIAARVHLKSTSGEIREVGEALNNLAGSLQEQDRLRKNTTADIAHELRTPLAIIRGQIEAFQDGVWELDDQKLQVCHDQVMQLVHLVDDLEKLADIENPMFKLLIERVNLNQLIKEAIHPLQSLWKEKDIQTTLTVNQSFYVLGDHQRLSQVFVNLLANAYKYNRDKGKIHIRIDEIDNYIRIEIQDTGVGISTEEIPYIFNRFYRGEKSRNRKTGGSGIGLAVVKGIVQAHKGKLSVQSQVNEGTTFTVFLPK